MSKITSRTVENLAEQFLHYLTESKPMLRPPRIEIDYETVVEAFSSSLQVKMRGHSTEYTFLDFWVADENHVLAITGMADSARMSGLEQISITFSTSLLSERERDELTKRMSAFSNVVLEIGAVGKSIVTARLMKPENSASDAKDRDFDAVQFKPIWSPQFKEVKKKCNSQVDEHKSLEANWVTPYFEKQLKKVPMDKSFEGTLNQVEQDAIVLSSEANGISLWLEFKIDTRITRAKFSGAPDKIVKRALQIFCQKSIGKPLQEVADHVGLFVIESLLNPTEAKPNLGINLPANCGACFEVGPTLARKIYEDFCQRNHIKSGTNFYLAPTPNFWKQMNQQSRVSRVRALVDGYLLEQGLNQGDIGLLRLEKNKSGDFVRAVIDFSNDVSSENKPGIMRSLEATIRDSLSVDIELISERVRDTSPLRRLSD